MGVEELLPPECRRAVEAIRAEARENVRRWPETLRKMPRATWPAGFPSSVEQVWRSQDVIVQVHAPEHEFRGFVHCRLSIAATTLDDTLEYSGHYTWEQLQAIKSAVGYDDFDAVEVFPRVRDEVNVANFRHLWIMRHPVPFAWRAHRGPRILL